MESLTWVCRLVRYGWEANLLERLGVGNRAPVREGRTLLPNMWLCNAHVKLDNITQTISKHSDFQSAFHSSHDLKRRAL